MFEGNFIESQMDTITLIIEDSLITEESLDQVIASFYSCEVQLTKQNVHFILVTARFLQCDEIVHKCEKFLTNSVDRTNCLKIYYFCNRYYLPYLEDFSFRWLLINLMIIKTNHLLINMTIELWVKLIKSSNFVIETEFILYQALRHYVQIRMIQNPTEKKISAIDVNYFKKRGGKLTTHNW